MAGLSAAAPLPLSGRYGPLAEQSGSGLRAWAAAHDVDLTVADCGEHPGDAGRLALELANRVDILFGPYGSGPTRAVAEALAGSNAVIWNHGGSAIERTGARMVDVLGPADRYWAGLAEVLAAGGDRLDRVAILHAPSGFGRQVAAGAVASLRGAGHQPLLVEAFEAVSAGRVAASAIERGAEVVVGCGRFEDDVALGQALAGAGVRVGLVACGVRAASAALGDAVLGWLGPSQWLGGDRPAPPGLGPDADYPAAQAYAAGLLALEAIERGGSHDPTAIWEAARTMRTTTFLGPFAIDADGRQLAHAPLIVRWVGGPAGPERRVAWRPPA